MNDIGELPAASLRKKADFAPGLLLSTDHPLCPGCGHPLALRVIMEVLQELALEGRSVGIFGHGCSALMIGSMDIDLNLSLHGRAPATATGVKRMRSETVVFTMQGDGDMLSEGLAEILHTAARGENITCFLLNNGVFGDTGGQMTPGSVVGQRTKTTMEGRIGEVHGYPVPIARLLSELDGVSYVACGSVHNAAGVVKTRQLVKAAFRHQLHGSGFSFVEILTMCPTGWITATNEGPEYMMSTLGHARQLGVLKQRTASAGTPEV